MNKAELDLAHVDVVVDAPRSQPGVVPKAATFETPSNTTDAVTILFIIVRLMKIAFLWRQPRFIWDEQRLDVDVALAGCSL